MPDQSSDRKTQMAAPSPNRQMLHNARTGAKLA
jgi:hypothetical protein